MKIFVSSRIRELFLERKTAIEAIHFEGHTPLYIETEPLVRDKPARDTMLALLRDADAFLSIHFLSAGREFSILDGMTPIKFELEQFRRLHPKAPIFLFRRIQEDTSPNHTMIRYFDDVAADRETAVVRFERPDELYNNLLDLLFAHRDRVDEGHAPYRVTIRYVGPDFAGLIGKLSEVVFARYRLNLDYISHAASEGHSTVCLSCTPRDQRGSSKTLHGRQIQRILLAAIRKELRGAKSDRRLVGNHRDIRPEIVVNVDKNVQPAMQFFVEVRAIDAPGQLNAVCKVLLERRYNIDELQLRPTPAEYPRQTTITFRLSRLDLDSAEPQRQLEMLESALRYLVGIRSFRTRIIRRYAPAQEGGILPAPGESRL